MAEFLDQILAETSILRAPIGGASPAGADIALEPEFERIKTEIDKLSNLSGGQVDWREVVKGADALLSTRTKDLRLAFWMACGEIDRGGWSGFARALVVCRAILTDYWEALHPARPKARSNIAAWFGERVNPAITELKVDLASGDAVRACDVLLGEIDALLSEKLADAYGGMGSARNTMRARVRDIPAPPPPPKAEEPVASGGSKPGKDEWADDDGPSPATDRTGGGGGVSLSARAEDAADTTKKCGDALVLLARSMRAQDPSRAWAYRLHRTGIWLPFDSIGDAAPPAPNADLRASVDALYASTRWTELLEAAEEASAQAPLWLSAHRFAATACERLGLAYANAREVIGRDATDFVRRAPQLALASFDDGTPFADEETRKWLLAEAARWQTVTARGETAAKDEDEKLRKRLEEARDLVARGHHAEGLALAGEIARRAADSRARFKATLAVADLAMNARAFDVARPLLDGLFAISESHQLETWEPKLCASLYAGLAKCLENEAREGRAGANERHVIVFERLCRVDPAAALRARGGGTVTHTNGVAGVVAAIASRISDVGASASPTPSSTSSSSSSSSQSSTSAGASSGGSGTKPGGESEWADDD